MKYLLITTTEARNVGDELIRIGIENLIKEIDPNPEFILLDKQKEEDWNNQIEFDKCILCGMPLFWNNTVGSSQTVGWWGALMEGWVSERKKDFLILGAGNAIGKYGLRDPIMYGAAIQQAIDRAYAVTTRNHVADHPKLIDSICPSAFAISGPKEPKYRLCNFMDDGAHDSHFDPDQSVIWREKIQTLSDFCKENDFYFVEHSRPDLQTRFEHGKDLGWDENRILCFNTAEEYIYLYAQAACYFGNRIHGAVVTASIGRPAIAVGYDSRLEMAKILGAETYNPDDVDIYDIVELLEREPKQPPDIGLEEKWKLLRLLQEFISA